MISDSEYEELSDDAQRAIQRATIAVSPESNQRECVWKHDEDHDCWDTSCGNAGCFLADGPKENDYRFCPYCGGRIVEQSESVAAGGEACAKR